MCARSPILTAARLAKTIGVAPFSPAQEMKILSLKLKRLKGHGLEWVNGHLWSASLDERKIYKVKAENGEVVFSFDSPGTRPHGLAWDGSHLWSVDTNDKVIYKHSSQSGEVLDSFECPEGTEPHGLAWDGSSLWYDDQFCNMLYKIEFLD